MAGDVFYRSKDGRHHDDAECEFAYDRESSIGRLDEANLKGWTVVSMKDDWKMIFPAAAK